MTVPDPIAYQSLPNFTDEERVERAAAAYRHLSNRRTCRDFTPDPVPRAVIEQAILAAGTAPSGANHQPWHFAVIGDANKKRAIRLAAEEEEREFYAGKAGQEWLEALAPLGTDPEKPFLEIAPWLIAVFAQRKGGPNPGDDRQNYYVTESVGIACGMLIATLHEAGLATLTHTPNPMKFLTDLCERPASEKPVMLIVTGKPATDATYPAAAADKKPLDAISSWF